jgi:P27 family predicted phage terminase small subunit
MPRPRFEPQPPPLVDLRPPGWLSERGRELWDQWAPHALGMGVLKVVDVQRFAMGCEAMSDYERARRLLERGWTTTGQKGARVVAPAVQLMRDAERRYDTFCARFGFDPSSRASLRVDPPALEGFAREGDPSYPFDV